jgi:hypothetical protein
MASPVYRPPIALRAFAALCGVAALLFNALLMLSDRAPGALRRIGGNAIRRLFERIDVDGSAAALSDPRLPDSDTIVHVVVWAVAVTLVGWALWTWIGLVVGAAVVFAGSLVVEFSQEDLSDTRHLEASDIAANLTGVVLGVVGVAMCYAAYGAVARWRRHRRW